MKKYVFYLLIFCGLVAPAFSQIKLIKEQILPLNHFEITADYGLLIDGVTGLDNQYCYAPADYNSPISWPHRVLIDLRGTYNITQLRAYDGYSTPTLNWYAGTTPFNTTLVAGPISLTGYNSYNIQNITANGIRYLILEQQENLSRFPSEIQIFGTLVSSIAPVTATPKPPVDAKQLLGANGFFWDPADKVGIFTNYRIFSETQWYFDANDKLRLSPAFSGGVHMKNQLTSFKNAGTESVVVLQKSPNYIMNKSATEHNGDYKPIPYNVTDYLKPANWHTIAKSYYRIAGYLGTTKIPSGDMNFNTTQDWPNQEVNVVESGLGLAKWIEILNEPDKNWSSPVTAGYFTPYALAALMSAAYDGHEETLSKAGAKAAHPNMKVAMGGIYKLQVEYVKAMHEWAKANRTDGKFPADALNFHHYNSNGGVQGAGNMSLPPEQGNMIAQMQQIVDYRDKYLPDLEIWLSEWGMSTNLGNLKVPELPSLGTKEDVQGAWMIRTYLTLLKLNIDRSHMYAMEDESQDANGTDLFGQTGIVRKSTLEFKKSYYYVNDFIQLFKNKDYKFKSDLSTNTVRDYVFEDTKLGKEMRFVWSPTGNETTISNYTVNITGSNIKGFQFTGGTHSVGNYTNSNTITVTEVPRVYLYDVKTVVTNVEEKYDLNEIVQNVIFPNPTSGKLTVKYDVRKVSILSAEGQLVKEFNGLAANSEIEVTGLPAGLYVVQITTEKGDLVSKKISKL